MRKKVIVLVSLLFVLVDMYAQTFYYDTTQVFYAQRYVCDVTQESKSVRLYSKSNKFTEVEAVNKETGAEITDAERKEANFVDDSQLWGKCLSILNESFSEEERTRVQGCKFIIILRVDTNTGIIRDVEYRFPAVSMLATVPVSVYQEMEIKLKKEIVFNITEKGKRYVVYRNSHNYLPRPLPVQNRPSPSCQYSQSSPLRHAYLISRLLYEPPVSQSTRLYKV